MGFIPWTSGIGLLAKNTIISYAMSSVTNKLFGPKKKSQSPTYSIGTLQTQTNSDSVMPIIYGKVKCAGNNLWQSGTGKTVYRLVGFGLGPIKGFSNVCLDDVLINAGVALKIYNTKYSDATVTIQSRDSFSGIVSAFEPFSFSRVLVLKYNGKTDVIGLGNDKICFMFNFEAVETSANTISELVKVIIKYDGWEISDNVGTSNTTDQIQSFSETPCYNNPISLTVPGLDGCSYTAYMGDGVQTIDSRVTGNTQEDKAKLVGGMKYDAYLAFTITANDKISSNPNVTAIVEGRIVKKYSVTAQDGYTLDLKTGYYVKEEWDDNVWCILDFMTSEYACNIPIKDIDINAFIIAAKYAQPGGN
ncbi:MAG: hypothetical protein ABFD50_05165 [Smithella sp.]